MMRKYLGLVLLIALGLATIASAQMSMNPNGFISGIVGSGFLPFVCTTSACPALVRSGANLRLKLADQSADTTLILGSLSVTGAINGLAGNTLVAASAPTISSGFGSSPSIVANNGTAAFTINVGTGASATNGVIGLPTIATGWNCFVNDLTAAAAHVAYNTVQTASTTATATVENQTKSTGAAIAWAASDILRVSCFAY